MSRIDYVIDVENRIVRTTFSGSVRWDDVAQHAARLRDDPAFVPEFSELIVFGPETEIRLQFFDFQALLGADPFSRTAKRAFVIGSRGAIYGSARVYQAARDNSTYVRIFDTLYEARLWLTDDQGQGARSCAS